MKDDYVWSGLTDWNWSFETGGRGHHAEQWSFSFDFDQSELRNPNTTRENTVSNAKSPIWNSVCQFLQAESGKPCMSDLELVLNYRSGETNVL